MSANLSAEGTGTTPAATPDTAGLGSGNVDQTAGNVAPASTQGEVWSRFQENIPEAPPAEAIPTPEASPESAAPTVEAIQPTPDPDADEFDKIDPNNARAQDFQAVRGRKKELERKLKLVEPIAAKVQALGDPQVIDLFAPIFGQFEGDDDPALYDAGKTVVQNLRNWEPRTADSLAAGVYEVYKPWMLQEALAEHGLTPADLTGFQEWKQSGGTAVRTVYQPTGFPVADHGGIVMLPDGTELNIGTPDDPTSGDPRDKVTYGLAKREWERDQRDEQQKADTAKETERLRDEEWAQVTKDRQLTWSNGELRAFEEYVAAKPLKIEGGLEADQKTAELLTQGVLSNLIEEDKDLRKWQDEGLRLAGQGAAKANALAMNIRQRTQEHYEKAQKQVTGIFTELVSLRKIVAGGRVQTEPRLPADTIPAQPGQPYTPPPPSRAGGSAYQNIFDRQMDENLPS